MKKIIILCLISLNLSNPNFQLQIPQPSKIIPVPDYYEELIDNYYLTTPYIEDFDSELMENFNFPSTNIIAFGDIIGEASNGFPVSRAFNIESNESYWRSGGSTEPKKTYLGVIYPYPIKIDAFRIISGSTPNTNIAFKKGYLQGCNKSNKNSNCSWENIIYIGDMMINEDSGIVDLDLSKYYYGYRIESLSVLAIANYYSRIRSLQLLIIK